MHKLKDIEKLNNEEKKQLMLDWFYSHYENPAVSTPYDSEEGGYIYIWGGPYNASEELWNQFGEVVEERLIDEVVNILETESFDWAGIPTPYDIDLEYFKTIDSNNNVYNTFIDSLNEIKELLDIDLSNNLKINLYKMLHVNLITILETYLSDLFINFVVNKNELLRQFIESTPEFEKKQIKYSNIYEELEKIEDTAREYMLKVLWHNIPKVQNMYKDTLGINFPNNSTEIIREINIRHDIVHRNGKSREGIQIDLKKHDVIDLLNNICDFVSDIDMQFKRLYCPTNYGNLEF